jgi:hypothetical protein
MPRGLGKIQKDVIGLLRGFPDMTAADLTRHFRAGEVATVQKSINGLIKRGLVVRTGFRDADCYALTKKAKLPPERTGKAALTGIVGGKGADKGSG